MKFNMNLKNLNRFDISRGLCNHLVGENHTQGHRLIAGTFIMAFGVGFVYFCGLSSFGLIHYFGDLIGYLAHGTGAVPFIDYFSKIGKKDEYKEPTTYKRTE